MRTQAYGAFMTAGRSALLSMQFVINYWSYYTGFLSTGLIGMLLVASACLVQCLRENHNGEMFETEDQAKKRKETVKKDGSATKNTSSRKGDSPMQRPTLKTNRNDLEKPILGEEQY